MAYDTGSLPLETLIGQVAKATETLVRLDERLARSPVREGWIERSHFHDAAAALWVEGELVHVEDLVFHDAAMDLRAPTHELTRAHAVLRMRRRILTQPRDWALGREGVRELTGRSRAASADEVGREGEGPPAEDDGADAWDVPEDDRLAEEFAEIDAVLARSSKVLAGADVPAKPLRPDDRPELIYDLDWDEDARLAEWQAVVADTRSLPSILRAAVLLEAWQEIEVLQRGGWVGPLLVAALLRQERVTDYHLACLHLGAQRIARERRRARGRTERILALIEAVQEAATFGLKEHDRLLLVREQMDRKLRGRRANSRLPAMIELVLSRPLVTTGMIQATLKVSRQGALDLVAAFGLREMTGRGRYKGWGIV
ncbi:RHE_PE00001 family protein [Mesorhizobium sp. KR9-304]|uniref:RHE_PE00001 family protein n=1 Tax=Mesorhizobium sp. KR9-304 TaxID=3156614 RepID=UPI0032B39988